MEPLKQNQAHGKIQENMSGDKQVGKIFIKNDVSQVQI